MRFADTSVLVTGAASGLGRAAALRFAAEGARVACVDLEPDGLAATVATIADAGGEATALVASVADEGAVRDAVAAAVDRYGRPSVVANIAGVLRMAHTHESTLDAWRLVLDVNLTGTYLVTREVLPHLLDGGGVVVNIGSTAGLRAQAYAAAYCASKAGVIHLTKALAEEYKDRGVRFNVVCPGGMNTPMVGNLQLPDDIDLRLLLKHTTPMGECTPDEVAGVVAFLASEEARYLTGAVVAVDGGITV